MATTNINLTRKIVVGTTTVESGTSGRIFFEDSSNNVNQDAELFWDNTNKRLGIGTATPSEKLEVKGNINISNNHSYKIGDDTAIRVYKNLDSINSSVAVGKAAGSNLDGQTSVGLEAGSLCSGAFLTMVGRTSGLSNTGDNLTALGASSGRSNVGDNCVFIGRDAGFNNTGTAVTGVGYFSLDDNTGGLSNAFGFLSGQNNSGDTCDFFGLESGRNNSGSKCAGLGNLTLKNNIGDENTNIGYRAGYYTTGTTVNTNSAKSVFLGANTYSGGSSRTNQIVIGEGAVGQGSNTAVIGNTSIVLTVLRGTVNMNDLPTSATGLNSGDVWNDGGTLKIV